MADGAHFRFPIPSRGVERATLDEQTTAIAEALSQRPVVVGGCCCGTSALRAASRGGWRLAVVWIDSHGDLNTPETRRRATSGECRSG